MASRLPLAMGQKEEKRHGRASADSVESDPREQGQRSRPEAGKRNGRAVSGQEGEGAGDAGQAGEAPALEPCIDRSEHG